jgi:D-alanyl-D-alanine carboxypeptidase (penicillin-binding protein 5/6)
MTAFCHYMNNQSKLLGMVDSHWAVAHGMYHPKNFSSAFDIALVTRAVLQKHRIFNEIVNCKAYECISNLATRHVYKWENTNKLLWDTSGKYGKSAFFGVKTGTTPAAGPCLCVTYRD